MVRFQLHTFVSFVQEIFCADMQLVYMLQRPNIAGSPLVLYDANLRTVVISPLNNFMVRFPSFNPLYLYNSGYHPFHVHQLEGWQPGDANLGRVHGRAARANRRSTSGMELLNNHLRRERCYQHV